MTLVVAPPNWYGFNMYTYLVIGTLMINEYKSSINTSNVVFYIIPNVSQTMPHVHFFIIYVPFIILVLVMNQPLINIV